MNARVLVLALFLGGCSGDGEAEQFAELGIAVENGVGARSQVTCEALPFLHGSRRLTEHVIDDAFTITVFSSSSEVRLTFDEGTRTLGQLVIPRRALEGEYSDELTLLLAGGEAYFVSITSGCAP